MPAPYRVAEGADLKLQQQIHALKSQVAAAHASDGNDTGGGGGAGKGDGAATEADVVALRDWTSTVTGGHDARIRRIEFGLNVMSERGGGSMGGGWLGENRWI